MEADNNNQSRPQPYRTVWKEEKSTQVKSAANETINFRRGNRKDSTSMVSAHTQQMGTMAKITRVTKLSRRPTVNQKPNNNKDKKSDRLLTRLPPLACTATIYPSN